MISYKKFLFIYENKLTLALYLLKTWYLIFIKELKGQVRMLK